MVQLVKRPILNFGLSHDLMVREFKPQIRLCADSVEPAWDSLFPSFSAPPQLSLKNKYINLKKSQDFEKIEISKHIKILRFLLTQW